MMKTYLLSEINARAAREPEAFIAESEKAYLDQINAAAEQVASVQKTHPLLLLNGPSSAGKTTTADRLCRALARHGIHTHVISMDDYYVTRNEETMPFDDENNVLDLESPLCMDLEMLSDHLYKLANGEEICMPRFDFETGIQHLNQNCLSLGPNDIAIIEGIHSFNDVITGALDEMSTAVSLRLDAQVDCGDGLILPPETLRFARRALRDSRFRGAPVEQTVTQWKSIRRGERLYINPYLDQAEITISTYHPYESCILYPALREKLHANAAALEAAGLADAVTASDLFGPIDYAPYIPEHSLLREFIG